MLTIVFISSTLRMLLMLCRWKKKERQTLLTCASIVKCSLKMAPRLRAEGDVVMLLSPIIMSLMLERGPTVGVTTTRASFHQIILANSLLFIHLSQ